MADIVLTQADADALISMEKHRTDATRWPYPGKKISQQPEFRTG